MQARDACEISKERGKQDAYSIGMVDLSNGLDIVREQAQD